MKESLSDIISEDKSIKIYKKKSSSDKFSVDNKSKTYKTKRPIEEIKLKIPIPKQNYQIQEIQIRKNSDSNPNREYLDDFIDYK